ncbi:uncharacterized protein [Nicotiana sylvestris]|uniref:uncharacterized protein n=1 Tax=Nicotiana sylvestris TaxID=4096 RepID=UPI00388C50E0
MGRGIPHTEKLFIGGDFNGHIVATSAGHDDVHECFANSSFPKKKEYLVAFQSLVVETQIDYLLCRKSDRCLCTDCKVIPSDNLLTLHRILVMDLGITRKRRNMAMYSKHRIKWEVLMEVKAQQVGVKLVTMGAWRSSGDTSAVWTTTAHCIREAAREVLGVSKGYSGGHKEDW